MYKIRVEGISWKMRNKIKQYGAWWTTEDKTLIGEICISTVVMIHNQSFPYSVWVKVGKDINIITME